MHDLERNDSEMTFIDDEDPEDDGRRGISDYDDYEMHIINITYVIGCPRRVMFLLQHESNIPLYIYF